MISNLIDPQEILDAAEESMFGMEAIGFCLACGTTNYAVEPDARRYECEECSQYAVYGAPELILMGYGG